MQKFADWEFRLAQEIKRAAATEFQWGTFDCGLAVCDCILALTGEDLGANYRGKYSTEAEAMALIGGELGTFAATLAEQVGAKEVAPGFGRRGDVVLVNNGDPANALGVVDLTGRFACCAGQRGTVRVPMRRWLRAWQIG